MGNGHHALQSVPGTTKGQRPESEPRLLDQVRHVIRLKHYSIRTEHSYVDWIKRFILFHNKQHPRDLGEDHITRFLTYLAVERKVASSTQNQALCAIVFLYRDVLNIELGEFNKVIWAKRPQKLPVVFTRNEVKQVLLQLCGNYWLMGQLLYHHDLHPCIKQGRQRGEKSRRQPF